ETVEELTENLVISGSQLLENIRLRGLENAEAFNISVRKTADYYISNLLSDQIRKQLIVIAQQLSQTKVALKEIISVTNFNLSSGESDISDATDISLLRKQRNIISNKLIQDINSEIYKVSELNKNFRIILNKALDDSFEPLSAAAIVKSSVGLNKLSLKSDQRKLFNRVSLLKDRFNKGIVSMMVKLFYRKSEGLLWANRLEIQNERASLYPYEPVKKMLESYSPNKAILEKLPFYYYNLFSESTAPGTDFWVGMKPELEKGSQAIKRFYAGTTGLLIVSGERSSGKSSLSRHLAELHFAKQNIYSVRAPKECTADVDLFDKMLLKKMNGNGLLTTYLEEMNDRKVVIINDLELWWERKSGGTAVIERIIFLMREYGNKLLFIVNVNKYALRVINQLTSISIWALDLLYCRPFDARELKDLIMVRHPAGGMKLVLNKKSDDEITNWEYASLFNRFFNLSLGNPGYAINLWLTGIKRISGNTIFISKPADKRISFPDEMQQEEIIVILQFILHRRFSIGRLSSMLDCEPENTERIIQTLFQKGILIEKFTGIYAIHPAIEIHLVKKLINIELL
ncbi:MAG: ATP-binding protein, partial [Bacteroidales bacterium]|nr:ATP-binding protein [Bacteroidales bacterium]